jgi:hypothetical protein
MVENRGTDSDVGRARRQRMSQFPRTLLNDAYAFNNALKTPMPIMVSVTMPSMMLEILVASSAHRIRLRERAGDLPDAK